MTPLPEGRGGSFNHFDMQVIEKVSPNIHLVYYFIIAELLFYLIARSIPP